jgi:hypothetical protein
MSATIRALVPGRRAVPRHSEFSIYVDESYRGAWRDVVIVEKLLEQS